MKIVTYLPIACSLLFSAATIANTTINDNDSLEMSLEKYNKLDSSEGSLRGFSDKDILKIVGESRASKREQKEVVELLNQDICDTKEMASFCLYAGRETVYKIRNLSWKAHRKGASFEEVIKQVTPILNTGIEKNLAMLFGEKGLSEEDLDLFTNETGQKPNNIQKKSFQSWFASFGCITDQKDLGYATSGISPMHSLHTCSMGSGFKFTFWIFSFGADMGVSQSIFTRTVELDLLPTGAQPQICANTKIGSIGNLQCNNNHWMSPVSLNFQWGGMASVNAIGSAQRLGTTFGTVRYLH